MKIRRLLSAGIIAVLTFSTTTGSIVHAEETDSADRVTKEQDTISEYEIQSIIPMKIAQYNMEYLNSAIAEIEAEASEDEDEYVAEEALDTQVYPEKYPDHFYLTEVNGKNYVSPVKMQGPWGTCWAFAAIAAAETSIMYESDMSVTAENPNPIDLSEKQVAWFTYTYLSEDYENNQGGEGCYCLDENGNVTNDQNVIYNQGGYATQAEQLFTSAIGPVYEHVLPYCPAEADASNYMDYIEYDSEGNPCNWAETGDWTVPDEMRQYYSFLLEESRQLPSSAGNNQEGVSAMKEELLAGRPIWIAYSADQYLPSQNNTAKGKYIYKNEGGQCSHYTYQKELPNHAVTVVGYNDDFSRYNFLEGHRPPGDGAWLVKNSWGQTEEYGVFPNADPYGWGNNGSGYFWLSYYDKSICLEQTLNFDLSEETMKEEARFVNEYDLMSSALPMEMSQELPSSYANIFTAEDEMNLREIGVISMERDSGISVSVYQLDQNAKNPSDGILLESLQKTFPYTGFHKILLDQKYELKKGQRFSVVVTERKEDQYYIPLHSVFNENMMNYANDYMGERVVTQYNVGVVNAGESYYYFNGVWNDLRDAIETGNQFFETKTGIQGGVLAVDNFPIKAYGEEK